MTDDQALPPYSVLLTPGARRALTTSLPAPAAFAAWEFISGPLAKNPRRVGAPLRAPFSGLWRALRGEYRIRYRINESSRQIVILDVDHRRDAYNS
ncbi:MAG: type II toxin-antitoxin system RelE/ParE family toxin [Actinomycetota bacterium]|nr:type II toxin-antitoxin system RelE/ParE family toxin [Actinomycetota bacterium]